MNQTYYTFYLWLENKRYWYGGYDIYDKFASPDDEELRKHLSVFKGMRYRIVKFEMSVIEEGIINEPVLAQPL